VRSAVECSGAGVDKKPLTAAAVGNNGPLVPFPIEPCCTAAATLTAPIPCLACTLVWDVQWLHKPGQQLKHMLCMLTDDAAVAAAGNVLHRRGSTAA
jgi:hypothetical protein